MKIDINGFIYSLTYALTEYIDDERKHNGMTSLGTHCFLGENNIRCFPFRGDTKGLILYHHENADGTGPFEKSNRDSSQGTNHSSRGYT